jgi:hypothetical protein
VSAMKEREEARLKSRTYKFASENNRVSFEFTAQFKIAQITRTGSTRSLDTHPTTLHGSKRLAPNKRKVLEIR